MKKSKVLLKPFVSSKSLTPINIKNAQKNAKQRSRLILIEKYNQTLIKRNLAIINQIIHDKPKSSINVEYKELVMNLDNKEYLKENYTLLECYRRLLKIYTYYAENVVIYPSYFNIELAKIIYFNLNQKQKLLDFKHEIDKQQELKQKKGSLRKEANHFSFQSESNFFDSEFYKSMERSLQKIKDDQKEEEDYMNYKEYEEIQMNKNIENSLFDIEVLIKKIEHPEKDEKEYIHKRTLKTTRIATKNDIMKLITKIEQRENKKDQEPMKFVKKFAENHINVFLTHTQVEQKETFPKTRTFPDTNDFLIKRRIKQEQNMRKTMILREIINKFKYEIRTTSLKTARTTNSDFFVKEKNANILKGIKPIDRQKYLLTYSDTLELKKFSENSKHKQFKPIINSDKPKSAKTKKSFNVNNFVSSTNLYQSDISKKMEENVFIDTNDRRKRLYSLILK